MTELTLGKISKPKESFYKYKLDFQTELLIWDNQFNYININWNLWEP